MGRPVGSPNHRARISLAPRYYNNSPIDAIPYRVTAKPGLEDEEARRAAFTEMEAYCLRGGVAPSTYAPPQVQEQTLYVTIDSDHESALWMKASRLGLRMERYKRDPHADYLHLKEALSQ